MKNLMFLSTFLLFRWLGFLYNFYFIKQILTMILRVLTSFWWKRLIDEDSMKEQRKFIMFNVFLYCKNQVILSVLYWGGIKRSSWFPRFNRICSRRASVSWGHYAAPSRRMPQYFVGMTRGYWNCFKFETISICKYSFLVNKNVPNEVWT